MPSQPGRVEPGLDQRRRRDRGGDLAGLVDHRGDHRGRLPRAHAHAVARRATGEVAPRGDERAAADVVPDRGDEQRRGRARRREPAHALGDVPPDPARALRHDPGRGRPSSDALARRRARLDVEDHAADDDDARRAVAFARRRRRRRRRRARVTRECGDAPPRGRGRVVAHRARLERRRGRPPRTDESSARSGLDQADHRGTGFEPMTASLKRDERLPIGLDQDLDRSAVGGAIFSALILAADWPSARIQNRLERSFQPFSRSRHSRTRDRIAPHASQWPLSPCPPPSSRSRSPPRARARPPRAAPRSRSPPTSGRCVRCDFRFRDDRRSLARSLDIARSLARSTPSRRSPPSTAADVSDPPKPNAKTRRLKTGARHLPRRARRGHGLPARERRRPLHEQSRGVRGHPRPLGDARHPRDRRAGASHGRALVRHRRALHAGELPRELLLPRRARAARAGGLRRAVLLGGARVRGGRRRSRGGVPRRDREPPEGVPGAEPVPGREVRPARVRGEGRPREAQAPGVEALPPRHGRVPRLPRAEGVHRRRPGGEPHVAHLRPDAQLLRVPDGAVEHVRYANV
eukprot:30936-Pelagococcus_subviridis.AAC.24